MSKVALTLMEGTVSHSNINNLSNHPETPMRITQDAAGLRVTDRMVEVDGAVIPIICNQGFNICKIKMLKQLFQESFLVKV